MLRPWHLRLSSWVGESVDNYTVSGSIDGMDVITVSDAAEELGVNQRRVRQLIERGDLRAERFGRQWMVHSADVKDLRATTRVAGHPYSPTNAWGLLLLASGAQPSWLSAADTRRLSTLLAERGIRTVIPLLRRRSQRESWFIHPSLLSRLASDPRTVRAGTSAVDALVSDGFLEIYVSGAVAQDLAMEFSADTHSRDGNVLVRVINGTWPFVPGQASVPRLVAAVDLLDRPGDDRRVRIAEEILAHV